MAVDDAKEICVFTAVIGDVEDPDLFADMRISTFIDSEAGKWCIAHAVEWPRWVREANTFSYDYSKMYRYHVMVKLSAVNETFWRLKWGHTSE